MQVPNKPEQIQVFFEIAMSIGTSLELDKMVKKSLLTYLRKLNCSSGALLKLNKYEEDKYRFESVLSIPYKSKFSEEFKDICALIPHEIDVVALTEFTSSLPLVKQTIRKDHYYLMNLPDFGLLCLKKSGIELDNDILFTLRTLNQKLAQACIACIRNRDVMDAKERAEESDRLKTAFIENISHEIRTPLNAVIGYSSLISDKQLSEKYLPTACKSIVVSSNKLLSLIEGLLDVSLLESGNLKLKYNLCNINQLMLDQEDVFYKYIRKEQKEHINMKVVTPLTEVFIVSDLVRLQQILDNLISNAIRFSNKGELELGYKKPEKQNKEKTIKNIVFYLKDHGIGMNDSLKQTIFKPFNRIQNSQDQIYEGTGIGLTITKHLVDLLGGNIWFESEPEKGSTFYFSIPAIHSVDELVSNL